MTYAEAIQFVTALSVLSVVVEKVIEIVKASFPSISSMENRKKSLLYTGLTFLLAIMASFFNPDAVPASLQKMHPVLMYGFIGALVSSGSGVWHTVLKMLTTLSIPKDKP